MFRPFALHPVRYTLPALQTLEPRVCLSVAYPESITTPGVGLFVVWADFDGDGDLDIASTPSPGQGTDPAFRLWLNDGAGHFSVAAEYAHADGAGTGGLLAVDIDSDGDQDLFADGSTLFRNAGGAAFDAGQVISGIPPAAALQPIDFDGDGLVDLLVAAAGATTITTLRNTGPGFAAAADITLTSPFAAFLGATDLDQDGDADAVISHQFTAPGNSVLLRTTPGTFDVRPQASSGFTATRMSDINADGHADLIGVQYGLVYGMDGLGDATFASPTIRMTSDSFVYGISSVLAPADLNADGVPDLLVFGRVGPDFATKVALGIGGGVFETASTTVLTRPQGPPNIGDPVIAGVGRFTPDPYANIVITQAALGGSELRLLVGAPGPAIASIQAPAGPIIPGQTVNFTARSVTYTRGGTGAVSVYADLGTPGGGPGNRVLVPVGSASGAGDLNIPVTLIDGFLTTGPRRFVVIATDAFASSREQAATIDVWTRVMYPEGFSSAGVSEYVPLVNPGNQTATYRIVARYESGDRDQVLAEGTLGATTRGGITIAEGPASLVRRGVGYSIEVQSSAPLGASFTHYDPFGGDPDSPYSIGESFTGSPDSSWGLADLSTASSDFVLFYNPFPTDVTVTTVFYTDQGASVTDVRSVAAYRRGGISLRDVGPLARDTAYAASVSATGDIVVAMSRYDTASHTALATLGQRGSGQIPVVVIPAIDLGTQWQVRVSNPDDQAASVTFTLAFDNGPPATTMSATIQPRTTRTFTAAQFDTGAAAAASVRIAATSRYFVQATSWDAQRHDTVSASSARQSATTWTFADAFASSPGSLFTQTLWVYNPSEAISIDVSVRFVFTDGSFEQRVFTIPTRSSRSLRLDDLPQISGHAPSTWYSVVLSSSAATVATMTHWDSVRRGGWATLGLPLLGIQPLE
ncbi:MAG: VCBS repeat-containing protein [Planctomycetes bacterium]|nr:VCBS repeat-containing protein [Planctomycetota bacterium]